LYVNTVRGARGAWRYDAATLDGQPMGLASVWLAPGGRWLMATNEAGVWQVLALDDERLIRGDLHNLTFSPNGRWVTAATGADQPIELLDGETLETVDTLPDGAGDGIRWKPDSTGWFTPAEAGTVQLWWVGADGDIQAGKRLGEPGEEMRWVWHPSDDRLMQYNPQGEATVYNAQTGDVVDMLQATEYESDPELTWFMDWTPNGRAYILYYYLYSSNPVGLDDNRGYFTYIHVDIDTREVLRTFFSTRQNGIKYTPDLQRIIDSSAVYDANTYEVLQNHRHPLYRLEISPDGKKAFGTGHSVEILQVHDLDTRAILFERDIQPNRSRLDIPQGEYYGWWSPDSTRLLTQDEASGLWLYNATTGEQLARQDKNRGYSQIISYSPDSSMVTVADGLNNLYLYDTQTGAALRALTDITLSPIEPISQMAWHPNNEYFAIRARQARTVNSGLELLKVFVWPTEGRLAYIIEQSTNAHSMIWALDGSRLIASFGNYLSAWYPPPRQPALETWNDVFGDYSSLEPSPDARFLVVTSSNATHAGLNINVRDARTLDRLLFRSLPTNQRYWAWTADSRQIRVLGTECEAYNCQIGLYVLFEADAPIEVETFSEPAYRFGAYGREPLLSWSPDGSKVAALADEYVDVWAVGSEQAELMDTYLLGESDRFEWGEDSTPQIIRTRDTGTFRPVFSPDGRTYITTEGGVLRMYRVGGSD
ncbi:MAG: WD40 repeat domain-containing protein, partial [Anaerolineae bacterium]|nr:WD40 repeat domain-containing protein [Anaerolineae bacterium]